MSGALDKEQREKLILLSETYPELASPKTPECLGILQRARVTKFRQKTELLAAYSECRHFILLLKGTIRIYQIAEDGREVTLYRVKPGEICAMSLNSLVNNKPCNASAKCDTDIEALIVSNADFFRAMQISETFRYLVLRSLTSNVNELANRFYNIAFQRLDVRVAYFLSQLCEGSQSDYICVTHKELAQELGTTREVISRILKQFERQHCITLARGRIIVNNKSMFHWFNKY